MISISALLWVFMGASAAFPDASEQFHKTYPLKEGTTVSVENGSGKIDVSVWDESYADVSAVKYTKRDKSELDKVSIEVSVNGSLTIKPEYRKNESKSSFSRIFGQGNSCGAQVSVDFTIKLPRAAVLREVKSVSGDIALSGTRGDASIRSVSGAIRAKDTEGTLELSAISGGMEIERGTLKTVNSISGDIILRDVQGNIRVRSVSGDIRVERAMGVVEAHSTSGDMSVSADAVRSATSISGDIDISAGTVSDAMEFSTISGDLRLRVPETTNADISMETVSGNLVNHSGLSLSLLSVSKRSISGRIGAGGKTISVKTTSGDVFLEK
jgi:hypothetical protein